MVSLISLAGTEPHAMASLISLDGTELHAMVFYSNLTLFKYSTAHAECSRGPSNTQAKMEGMLTLNYALPTLAPVCCALSACVYTSYMT